MNRCIGILGVVLALGAGLFAQSALACTQETADRLAATDTQALRDADMLAASDFISFAVLTAVTSARPPESEGDLYSFTVEVTLRGPQVPAFETESMVVFSCRHGDQSWHLDRLRVGDRVLVLGDISADGRSWPRYIMPARDRRARRLLALFQRTSAGE